MGELTFGGWGDDKNLVGGGPTGEIFPGWSNEQIFSWREDRRISTQGGTLIYFGIYKYIYIYINGHQSYQS